MRAGTLCLSTIVAFAASIAFAIAGAAQATETDPTGPYGQEYTAYRQHFRKATALLSPPAVDRHTTLPTRWSDGASHDLVFSQDNRQVRLIAYDSSATALVPGDANGVTDVFVFHRARGGGNLWGRLERASVSSAGVEGDGPSRRPSLDGETRASAHCVSFESRATNLDPRDRTPDWDVFVRDLRSHRTSLVSVGDRDARRAVIDGRCATVTFESRGSVWVRSLPRRRTFRIARGADPDQQTNGEGVAYVRKGQVWYRSFRITGPRFSLGRERLVSATAAGRPGNGRSSDPAVDDRGTFVAFESLASDLCRHACLDEPDDGGVSDVFRRSLARSASPRHRMWMASAFSRDVYEPVTGASNNPVISAAGQTVIFESEVGPRPPSYNPNGAARSLYSWIMPPGARPGTHVTRPLYPRPGCAYGCKAAEEKPAMSARGNYVAYESTMSEFCSGEAAPAPAPARPCPTFSDVFALFVGRSFDRRRLG